MTHQSFLLHRHVSRPAPRQANLEADPPTSPGAAGAMRGAVKVANLIASHYGFARKPQDTIEHDLPTGTIRCASPTSTRIPAADPASLHNHTNPHPERRRRAGTKQARRTRSAKSPALGVARASSVG